MSKKLEEYTNEELIKIIHSLKSAKKFGLVWEDKPEQVAIDCEKKLPVLIEVMDRNIKNDESALSNLIIEGDNYHSLAALNYTHTGKIDAIYIDPPYNTGNTSWIYNNKIIDSNDTYRHSKWLSFMNKRLKLAKSLLKDEGIIVVTIDDYEVATLTLLMNEIFGEENHLGTVVIKNNPSGRSTASGFSVAHEYALFYGKQPTATIGRLKRTDAQISRYKEKDTIGRFEWVNFRKHGGYRNESPKMFYPIYINPKKNSIRIPDLEWDSSKKDWVTLQDPDAEEIVIYPIDDVGKERRWKWSIERARSEISEMKVSLDRNKKPAVYIKARMKDEGMLPLTWWDKSEYSATAHGTNLLARIIPDSDRFDYPKSLHAVSDSLRVLSEKKDALFLDFFAGSGTTGHAVLELNKEDGGSRQFILCTNNENGIAENITYERIRKVTSGYASVPGLPANVRYFKTDFVDKQKTNDQTRLALIERCTDMIRVRENAYDYLINEDKLKLLSSNDHNAAIIFDPNRIEEFFKKIEEIDHQKPLNAYIFSYSNYAYDDDIPETKLQYSLCPIPESVLEVYRRIFGENENV